MVFLFEVVSQKVCIVYLIQIANVLIYFIYFNSKEGESPKGVAVGGFPFFCLVNLPI